MNAPAAGAHVSRREWLASAAGLGLMLPFPAMLAGCTKASPTAAPIIGTLVEPTTLTAATTSIGAVQLVSSKIFDGLLGYAPDLSPIPRLATAWETAPDARSITLHLRPRVKWHDGTAFTSTDVAFSLLKVWKLFHSRGRSTFAHVNAVDTPDSLTAVLRLDKPSPQILSALASNESQVIPAHLYAGKDILSNPANLAPVGTGPFKFGEWQRGQFIRLERNTDYWDVGKPHLDGLTFRFFSDSSSEAAALEAGEAQMAVDIAISDVARLSGRPGIQTDDRDYALQTAATALEFNLDLPKFKDVRVRRAIAHAIDGDFIHEHILFRHGRIATGPIPHNMPAWYSGDVPHYPFDRAKATALLQEAGLKPGEDGVRLSFTLDPLPVGSQSTRLAEYIRGALAAVGVQVKLRNQDFATFVKRIYTDHDFETIITGGQMGPDPAIGTQRFYWSKSIQKGIAFSNACHYASPEADRLLESAQIESDPIKRRALYADFQRLTQTDLPRIPLVEYQNILLSSGLNPLPATAEGSYGNFADLRRI